MPLGKNPEQESLFNKARKKEVADLLEMVIFQELRNSHVSRNPILYQFYLYVLYQNKEIGDYWSKDKTDSFDKFIEDIEPLVDTTEVTYQIDCEIIRNNESDADESASENEERTQIAEVNSSEIYIFKQILNVPRNITSFNLGRDLAREDLTAEQCSERLPKADEVNKYIKSLIVKNIDPERFELNEFVRIAISHGLTEEMAKHYSGKLGEEIEKARADELRNRIELTTSQAQSSLSTEAILVLEARMKAGDYTACLSLGALWESEQWKNNRLGAVELILQAEAVGLVEAFDFITKLCFDESLSHDLKQIVISFLKTRHYLDTDGKLIDLKTLKQLPSNIEAQSKLANIYLTIGIYYLRAEQYSLATSNFFQSANCCHDLSGSIALNYLFQLEKNKSLYEAALELARLYYNHQQRENAIVYGRLALQHLEAKLKTSSDATSVEVREKIGDCCSLLYSLTNDANYKTKALRSYQQVVKVLQDKNSKIKDQAVLVRLARQYADLYEKSYKFSSDVQTLNLALKQWEYIFKCVSNDKEKNEDSLQLWRLSQYKLGEFLSIRYQIQKSHTDILSCISYLVSVDALSLRMGLKDELASKTIELIQQIVSLGDASVICSLGKLYYLAQNILSINVNPDKSIELIQQMIDLGDVSVVFSLRSLYYSAKNLFNSNVSPNIFSQILARAKQYLELALKQGNSIAAYWLVKLYIQQNLLELAKSYFLLLIESNGADPAMLCYKLSVCYELPELEKGSQAPLLKTEKLYELVDSFLASARAREDVPEDIVTLRNEDFSKVVAKFDEDKKREIFRGAAKLLLERKENAIALKYLVKAVQYSEKTIDDIDKIMELLKEIDPSKIKDFGEYEKEETENIFHLTLNILKFISLIKFRKALHSDYSEPYTYLMQSCGPFYQCLKEYNQPLPHLVEVVLKMAAHVFYDAFQESLRNPSLLENRTEWNQNFLNYVVCWIFCIEKFSDVRETVLGFLKEHEVARHIIYCRVGYNVFDDYLRIIKENSSPKEIDSLIKFSLKEIDDEVGFFPGKIILLCTLQLLVKNSEFYSEINKTCIDLISFLQCSVDRIPPRSESEIKSLTRAATLIDDIFYQQYQQRLPSWAHCKALAISHWMRLNLRNEACLGYLKAVAKEDDMAKYAVGQFYQTATIYPLSERAKAIEYFFELIDRFKYEEDIAEKDIIDHGVKVAPNSLIMKTYWGKSFNVKAQALSALVTMANSKDNIDQYEYPPEVRRDIFLKLAKSLLGKYKIEKVVEWFRQAVELEYVINPMSDMVLREIERGVAYVTMVGDKKVGSCLGKLFYDLAIFYRSKCLLTAEHCYARVIMLECNEVLEDKTKDHIKITDATILRNLKLFFFINKLSKWKDEATTLFNRKRISPAEKLSAQQESLITGIDLVCRLIDALHQCMRNDDSPAFLKRDGTKISLKNDAEIRAFIENIKNSKTSEPDGDISLSELLATYDDYEKNLSQKYSLVFSN